MGIDLLAITWEAEREFGITIPQQPLFDRLRERVDSSQTVALESGESVPRDITVQQLFDVVCGFAEAQQGCVPPDAWPRFARCVKRVLMVDDHEIIPAAYLERDLGMS